jgi:hypothetical protein
LALLLIILLILLDAQGIDPEPHDPVLLADIPERIQKVRSDLKLPDLRVEAGASVVLVLDADKPLFLVVALLP